MLIYGHLSSEFLEQDLSVALNVVFITDKKSGAMYRFLGVICRWETLVLYHMEEKYRKIAEIHSRNPPSSIFY